MLFTSNSSQPTSVFESCSGRNRLPRIAFWSFTILISCGLTLQLNAQIRITDDTLTDRRFTDIPQQQPLSKQEVRSSKKTDRKVTTIRDQDFSALPSNSTPTTAKPREAPKQPTPPRESPQPATPTPNPLAGSLTPSPPTNRATADSIPAMNQISSGESTSELAETAGQPAAKTARLSLPVAKKKVTPEASPSLSPQQPDYPVPDLPSHNLPDIKIDADPPSPQEVSAPATSESLTDTLPPLSTNADVTAQDAKPASPSGSWSFQKLTDRKTLPSTVQMIISVAAISLVPAILLMTTCFIRIVVVLGILRQAIGLQQLPPAQVTTALALMMTFLIMAPTWKEVKQTAIDPYSAEGSEMSWDEAWEAGTAPVKKFMWGQILRAENEEDFWVFYDYLPTEEKAKAPQSHAEVPLKVLLPAFMISELKVAFLIGIQVLLPFLILDIVVASLCNTMGLIMLPPAVVSLPLKLLLFVMVDGWNLVVAMLLNSFSIL